MLCGADGRRRAAVPEFGGIQNVDPGMDARNVLSFRVTLPTQHYKEPQKKIDFFAQAADKLSQLPGVRSSSATSYLPLNGIGAATGVKISGQPPAKPGEEFVATIRTVLPGYFRTMGIPLKRGRDFNAAMMWKPLRIVSS